MDDPASIANDANDGRELYCADLASDCNHPVNGPAIKKMCPASCGTCGAVPQGVKAPQGMKPLPASKSPKAPQATTTPQGTQCVDATTQIGKDPSGKELYCSDVADDWCSDAQHGPAIQRLCPATCGTCTAAPHVTKAPKDTEASQATEAPATKAPRATKAPQATKAPHATKAPPSTKAPVATQVPSTASGACADATGALAKTPEGRQLFCKDLAVDCKHETNGPTIKKMCPPSCGVCSASSTFV